MPTTTADLDVVTSHKGLLAAFLENTSLKFGFQVLNDQLS